MSRAAADDPCPLIMLDTGLQRMQHEIGSFEHDLNLKRSTVSGGYGLAGGLGFEPRLTESESGWSC